MIKFNNKKGINKEKSKVLERVSALKLQSPDPKKEMFKVGDTLFFKDEKFQVDLAYRCLGRSKDRIAYKLTVLSSKGKGVSESEVWTQNTIIADMFEKRFDLDTVCVAETVNVYDLNTEIKLEATSDKEYTMKMKSLNRSIKKLNIYEDFEIGISYDTSDYNYWKKRNFENTIKIVVTINNHQLDISEFTGIIRTAKNIVEMV